MGSSTSKILPNKNLRGKTAIVTGSNSGIGKVTAKELYRLGARVIMACRDVSTAKDALGDIKNETKDENNVGELIIKELNLSSFASIRKCASDINESEKEVHFLINNAGMFMTKGKTEDGFELQFGVNHLGHFLFTCLLLPKLIKSAPAKIINVSSKAHEKGVMDWEDLNFEKKTYRPLQAYSQSKLANVLFTKELAKRLAGTGVTAFSLHPGVIKTNLGRHLDNTYFSGARMIIGFLISPMTISVEEGAKTTLYCVLADNEAESGSYYSDCQLREPSQAAKNEEDAQKLWEVSSKIVNLDFDPFKLDGTM